LALAERLGYLLSRVTPAQSLVLLCASASVTFLARGHRLAPASLLAQYVFMGLLILPRVFDPVLYLLVGLGVAVSVVLYMSGLRVARGIVAGESGGAGEPGGQEQGTRRAMAASDLGPGYSTLVLILAALSAYGMWRAYPLTPLPEHMSLGGYWLVAMGVFLCLVAAEPLRMGYGLITLMNGIVCVYLQIERSLIVFVLLGMVYAVIVMGTVICTEGWIDTGQGDVER